MRGLEKLSFRGASAAREPGIHLLSTTHAATSTPGSACGGPGATAVGHALQRLEKKSAIPREAVVAAARRWLGTPYVHQASAKGAGADCLGLVIGLYTELMGRAPETPPPYTPDWNERRPCDEPLLSAARRHLVEAGPPLPRKAGELSAKPAEGALEARPAFADGARPPSHAARDSSPVKNGGAQAKTFRPGQILIFRIVSTGPAKHCGIVSASDRFIHAYAGRAVIESWLCRWWTERVAGVFDFPGVEG